jgi:hypothetical protein
MIGIEKPSNIPYAINKIQPIVLMILRLEIFFIRKEIKTVNEAR